MAVQIFTPNPGQKVDQCPVWVENPCYRKYALPPFCEELRKNCPYTPDMFMAECWLFMGGDTIEFFER